MNTSITIRHNFETAHRLPQLGGKCTNLHGHSWWATVTVGAAHLDTDGVVIDFGRIKAGVRGWIDRHLDHAAMLAAADPLVAALTAEGCRVYRFGATDATGPERLAAGLDYPTVEMVAELLYDVTREVLGELVPVGDADRVAVLSVQVSETHVNAATFLPTA